MTDKPNSVCKHCRKPIKFVAAFWYTAERLKEAIDSSDVTLAGVCSRNPKFSHEPVAEPAEPSASPIWCPVDGCEMPFGSSCATCLPTPSAEPTAEQRVRVVDYDDKDVPIWKRPAPQPVAGEGPHFDDPRELDAYMSMADMWEHELAAIGQLLPLNLSDEPLSVSERAKLYIDQLKGSAPAGTPKLVRMAWKIYLHDRKGYGNAITAQGVVSEWVEILRPFIAPACQSSIKFAGERADSPMASQSRTAMTSPAIQSTPASTGEPCLWCEQGNKPVHRAHWLQGGRWVQPCPTAPPQPDQERRNGELSDLLDDYRTEIVREMASQPCAPSEVRAEILARFAPPPK